MTTQDAIKVIETEIKCVQKECDIESNCGKCPLSIPMFEVKESSDADSN